MFVNFPTKKYTRQSYYLRNNSCLVKHTGQLFKKITHCSKNLEVISQILTLQDGKSRADQLGDWCHLWTSAFRFPPPLHPQVLIFLTSPLFPYYVPPATNVCHSYLLCLSLLSVFSSLEYTPHQGMDLLSCSPMESKCLEQCMVLSRCSINTCHIHLKSIIKNPHRATEIHMQQSPLKGFLFS